MSVQRKIQKRTLRRALRTRSALGMDDCKPRVSVFRSLTHMYAQLIDDAKQMTLASASTLALKELKGTKTERSYAVGVALAEQAIKLGVTEVKFDRGACKYHGRVKAVAEGLRAGGLHV